MVVFLQDLIVKGKHGVHEHEKLTAQPFKVSVELELLDSKSTESDNLADTVDWSEIRKSVIRTVEGTSFNLVERLAGEIARRLLEDKRIGSVTVTIEKTSAFKDGSLPGVRLTRANS